MSEFEIDKLELDTMPEYVREPREGLDTPHARKSNKTGWFDKRGKAHASKSKVNLPGEQQQTYPAYPSVKPKTPVSLPAERQTESAAKTAVLYEQEAQTSESQAIDLSNIAAKFPMLDLSGAKERLERTTMSDLEPSIPEPTVRQPKITLERYQIDELEGQQFAHKSAELEALWPGVAADFMHGHQRKAPGFYLTIGFVSGIVVALVGVWGASSVVNMFSGTPNTANDPKQQKVILSRGHNATSSTNNTNVAQAPIAATQATVTTRVPSDSTAELVVPMVTEYEVKPGDTLAGIALKTYKRVSPRLLDEICKANNMRSANVLNLGQKLVLPEYRPQTTQLATGASSLQ